MNYESITIQEDAAFIAEDSSREEITEDGADDLHILTIETTLNTITTMRDMPLQ
jgi:hypothetical protein